MNQLKMLGLSVMASVLLMVFAGSASAATFTAPSGTEYTGSFDMSLEGSLLMKNGFAETTCTHGTIQGSIIANDETAVGGVFSKFELSNCGQMTVDTLNNNGTLKIDKSNTAVTATGVEVTFSTAGTSCVYGFGATSTSLGTAANTASGVTLAIKASIGKVSGGFLCASPAHWTGNYVFTTPTGSVAD